MKKLTREKWIELFSGQLMMNAGMNVEDSEREAEIYLDDVLDGDIDEDPMTSAIDCMNDWN